MAAGASSSTLTDATGISSSTAPPLASPLSASANTGVPINEGVLIDIRTNYGQDGARSKVLHVD